MVFDAITQFPPRIPVVQKLIPFRKEIAELFVVGLLMIHEGLVELIFNELFMVICVGETSIGKSVEDWSFNCSFILIIVQVVCGILPIPESTML